MKSGSDTKISPGITVVASDRLNENTVIIELSNGTSVMLSVDDILAFYPKREAIPQN